MEPKPFHWNITPYSQCKDIPVLQKDKTTIKVSKLSEKISSKSISDAYVGTFTGKSFQHSLLMEQLILRILLLKATSFAGIYFKAEIKILNFLKLKQNELTVPSGRQLGFCRTFKPDKDRLILYFRSSPEF